MKRHVPLELYVCNLGEYRCIQMDETFDQLVLDVTSGLCTSVLIPQSLP